MDKLTPALFSKISVIGANDKHANPDGSILQLSKVINDERHDTLRGAYAGKVAFILTCGPSLDEVWSDELRDVLSHKLAPEIADFHLYNEVRMEDYDYGGNATLRLSVSQFMPDHPSHIHYPISQYKYDDALFVTNDYDKWDLSNGVQRPWGVGIMFELGLHLPLYLGCRAAVIIGFDMNKHGKYHFYDQADQEDSQHYKVDAEEFDYAKHSSKHYAEWANSKGLEVVLYSPLSSLDIPKITRNLVPSYLW